MRKESQPFQNFDGITEALIVSVLEGKGVAEDPMRLVRYIYHREESGELRYIGALDPRLSETLTPTDVTKPE